MTCSSLLSHQSIDDYLVMQTALNDPCITTVAIADCLQSRWGSYIRDGPLEQVQGFGMRALTY